MLYYIISITDKKGTAFYEKLSVNGFPIDTTNRKDAYRFDNRTDALKYSTAFNINLRYCYNQNKVSDENQYYYQVQSMNDDIYQFYLSAMVENENGEIVLDVCRKPFESSLDDAIDELRSIIRKEKGIVTEGKIESLKGGIATIGFVDEYCLDLYEDAQSY